MKEIMQEHMHGDQQNMPFGGKIIILGGDPHQTLAIVKRGNKAEIVQNCIISSPIWNSFTKIEITENIRQQRDRPYSDYCSQLANENSDDGIIIPPSVAKSATLMDMIEFVFNDHGRWNFNNRMILAPTNEEVDGINSTILQMLPGQSIEYNAVDSIIGNNPLNIDPEVLNALDYSGIPQAKLMLKVGVSVMLIRNLNIDAGLVNGTMLKVLTLNRNSIKCQIINGSRKNDIVSIPKIGITVSEFENVEFVRHQFPVRLAFAATINKAQGQTLAKCGIYLQQQVFAHGQLYVAFSRVRSSSDVTVCYEDAPKNIVYQDVIRTFTT
ncbi:hypothetical protein MP228_002200 [Amoeboaphelidium protococcarum]|nr:hypothetical protein MP228_011703 [Amoeboaphelidium protococcarum]KAI3642515.1 hypothetical protein MP228_012070 [Amoeboaphelidium protococcarum]KAI3652775.1 hypothetical protein MP228_002200 [Amoeboaphelidium protococcarum]